MVVLEKQGFAAADFAAVQDEDFAVFVLGECAGQGAVDALGREVDFGGERDFFAGNGRAQAEAVPAFFAVLRLRVPQIQLGRVGGFGVQSAVDGGDGAGDFLAESGLQGLGETRLGGGELGGVGDNDEHGVSFACGGWKGSLKMGFQAAFGWL